MPIYEFYCPDCHRIFNFFSRRMNTTGQPDCPKCGRPRLDRRVSLFAVSKNRPEKEPGGGDEGPMPDIDESRLESVLEGLASEAEGIDEDDPRQAGKLMRRLFDATGLKPGSGLEEAMRRMEAGEDPDQIEAEMGDVLENEDPFAEGQQGRAPGQRLSFKSLRRQILPPSVDETLYEM